MSNVTMISAYELHQMLNARAGRQIPSRDFDVLVICWRKHRHVNVHGKLKTISLRLAQDFLKYAY